MWAMIGLAEPDLDKVVGLDAGIRSLVGHIEEDAH